MSADATLPLFPLNTVLFPGATLPLHVFEDRYRAMVRALLALEPEERHFASVAIREGYEVGEHGAQSLFRVGVKLQVTDVEEQPDGSFEIEATALQRIRLDRVLSDGDYPVGEISDLPEPSVSVAEDSLDASRAVFTAYRAALSTLTTDPYSGTLPRDPEYLSWTLAACAPLPLADRQLLLEAGDAEERLALVTDLLRDELRAINVIPSLPATDVARTRWSPN